MNSSLYTAASGLLVEERRLELTSHNLANVSTPGFRSQRAFSSVFAATDPAADANANLVNRAVALAGAYEVPGPGPRRLTGRDLDVLLGKDDLFVVRTPGGLRYTRAASLEVNADGVLTDASGFPLLDAEDKEITGIGPGARVDVDGQVFDADGQRGRARVVRDTQQLLLRRGDNLYAAPGSYTPETVEQPELRSGWLEGSGTNALGELLELIQSQRAFEGYQRLIGLTMNEVNKRAVNEIAG